MPAPKISQKPLIGAHVSAAGGTYTAFERAEQLGIGTFQLFVKNNKQWFAPAPLSDEDIRVFKERRERWSGKGPIVAHACYLINLATANPEMHDRSVLSFREELKRADQLGVEQLVFHPGAHLGIGEEAGVQNVIAGLDKVHRETPDVRTKSIVEITAGQGSSVGCSFEQLGAILKGVEQPERMGVCLDTCHMFAAGYDIRTEEVWNETFRKFESLVGFKYLVSVHTNDSKKGFGSRVDRHEWLGEGEIGLEAFRLLMNDPRFENVPKILETPKDEKMTEDYVNLEILTKLQGESRVPSNIKGLWKKKRVELGFE